MSEISTQKPIRETASRTIRTLRPADADYPPMLRDIPDPPPCLYAIGDTSLLRQRALAVVGSRKCSEYGKRIAMQIGKTAAQNQVVLVSGMAKGIDSFAHLGALRAGGKTIAGSISAIHERTRSSMRRLPRKDFCFLSFHRVCSPDRRRSRSVTASSQGLRRR